MSSVMAVSGVSGMTTPINSTVSAEAAASGSGVITKKVVLTVIAVVAVIWIAYDYFFIPNLERELKRVASFGEADEAVQNVFIDRVVIQNPWTGHNGIGLRHVSTPVQWERDATEGIPHPGGDALNMIMYPFSYLNDSRATAFLNMPRDKMIVKYKKALIKFIKGDGYQSDAPYTPKTTMASALAVLNQTRFSYVYEWGAKPYDFSYYHGLGKLGKKTRPVGSIRQIEPLTFANLGISDSFRSYGKLTEKEFNLLHEHIAACMLKAIFSNPPS